MPDQEPQNAGVITNNLNTTMVDTNDPYYISPSDNPGQVFVTNPFDGSNFSHWKQSMLIILGAKAKLAFIDGTLPKPAANDANVHKWVRCNAMVTAWLVNTLSPDIADSVITLPSAKDIWDDINERFGLTNSALMFEVEKKLANVEQGNDSVTSYYTRLRRTWDEMRQVWSLPVCSCNCTCGASREIAKHEQDMKVIQFLMGLNDSYSFIRGNILMISPLPSLASAYSTIIQEEKQREMSSRGGIVSDFSAFAAQRMWNPQQHQHNKGNFRPNAPVNSYNNGSAPYGRNNSNGKPYSAGSSTNQQNNDDYKNKYYCTGCNVKGHSWDRCFKNPNRKNKDKGPKNYAGYSFQQPQNGQSRIKPQGSHPQHNIAAASLSNDYQQVLSGLSNLNASSSVEQGHAMSAGLFDDEPFDYWSGA